MITITTTASSNTILAIDLGKYKCVACILEQNSEFRFTTFDTSRAELQGFFCEEMQGQQCMQLFLAEQCRERRANGPLLGKRPFFHGFWRFERSIGRWTSGPAGVVGYCPRDAVPYFDAAIGAPAGSGRPATSWPRSYR